VKPKRELITSKLAALHFYQLAIPAPTPEKKSFDEEAASRGQSLFVGKAKCAGCHVPPLFTEPGWGLHTPDELVLMIFKRVGLLINALGQRHYEAFSHA
jgi:hypothetical protein